MPTTLEIAREIGATKQQVYRYIKRNHISEVDASASPKQYSEADAERIKQGIKSQKAKQSRSTSEADQKANKNASAALYKLIDQQQETITTLTRLLDQEQKLRMIAEQKLMAIEQKNSEPEPPKKKHWWQFGAE